MKHTMRLSLLPFAVAMLASPLAAHGEDLMQAYRAALQNDPVLQQSGATLRSSKEGVIQARSQLLPQISAQAGLSQTSGGNNYSSLAGYDANGLPIYSTSNAGYTRQRQYSASLSQTIFDFGKIESLKTAHSQENAQDATYRAAEQDLMVRVATAYFNVLQAMDTLKYQKANAASLKRQMEQAQERFKVGLSAITDVQDAKAQYEAAQANVIAAENTLADQREALTQITGTPSDNLQVLSRNLPLTPPAPADQSTWVKTALDQNPTLQSSSYSVNAAEHSISQARSGHLPTLNASVSWNKSATWAENGGITGGSRPASTTVGLTLTIPIFTGGYTQSQVRQAIDQRDSAQAARTQERRQVIRDTRNYYRSVTAGISQVKATKASVKSAESALQATQAGFKVGTQTIVAVLLAQSTLISSQQQYSQARHQFVLNKLLLRQAAGTLTPEDLTRVNALLVRQGQQQEGP